MSVPGAPVLLAVLLAIYYLVLGVLALYGLHRLALVVLYLRTRDRVPVRPADPEDWPVVTVQLPLYNEMYVARRLIEAACRLDYPAGRLEIQVLDDSTDETSEIVARVVEEQRGLGARRPPPPPGGPARFQGGSPGGRAEPSPGRADRGLRRRLRAAGRFPPPDRAVLRGRGSGHGPGELGAHQPRLFAADPGAGGPAGRPFPDRAHGPQPERLLFQLQRHGGDLAPAGDRDAREAGSTTP